VRFCKQALRYRILGNEVKDFTERLTRFLPSGKEQRFALENIFKKSSLMWYSVLPSQDVHNSPDYSNVHLDQKEIFYILNAD